MLKGDNPPVYRGAMDFASDPKAAKKKGPKMEAVGSGLDGGPTRSPRTTRPRPAGPASTDVAAAGPAPDMVPKGAFNATSEEEAVKDHPSGCGCVVAGADGGIALVARAARRGRGGPSRGRALLRRR